MSYLATSTAQYVVDELAIRLNEISADEQTVYLGWLNQCTNEIALSFPNAPFLYVSADRTLSAGIRHYTNLPTDFEKMIDVVYPAGDVKLKHLTEEEFDVLQPSASEGGTPTIYTIHGATVTGSSQIEFYPVPGSGLTVNYKYRKSLTTVSVVSAALPIPAKYGELYVLYGQSKGLERREQYEQANIMDAKFREMVEKMKADFKRVTEEPWRIKSIREFQSSNKAYGDEIVNLFWGEN